ncbi:MAG TPA: phosphate acyltransferase [Bacillota bacterium]|jgi:phosphate butyryltransferase
MSISNFDEAIALAARRGPRRVAVAAAADRMVMTALGQATKLGLVSPVMVGDARSIQELAGEDEAWSGRRPRVVDCPDPQQAARLAAEMTGRGEADMIMKGHLATGDFLRAILEPAAGLRRGGLLSHIAVIGLPAYPKLLFVTDGGLNVDPNLDRKAAILRNAVDALVKLGTASPKAACLTAAEEVSPGIPATTDAAALAERAGRGEFLPAEVEGPIALDVALSPEAAAVKGLQSRIAGQVDILLAPYMEVANILVKGLIYLAGARAAGVVVGAAAPVIMLSRADTPDTRLNSLAIGSLLG